MNRKVSSQQIAIGSKGDIDLWCEDRGYDDNGGLRFWVINGHWYGVLHHGNIWITDDEYKGQPKPYLGKLIWRGFAPFEGEQYNESMMWLRERLKSHPHLENFFNTMEFNMTKISFNDAVEKVDTTAHNERVESLAHAYHSTQGAIKALEAKIVAAEEYLAELSTAGEKVETLDSKAFSTLYNKFHNFVVS